MSTLMHALSLSGLTFYAVHYFLHLAIALHGRCCVDCVTVQTVTWHLMAHHTCDHHARVDPCEQSKRSAQSLKTPTQAQRQARTHPTHQHESECCCRWMGLSGDLWSAPCPAPCHRCYGRGTSSSLERQPPPCRRLQWSQPGKDRDSSSEAAGLTDNVGGCGGKISTQTLKTRCFSLSVSKRVYMVLSMETTCMGVMWLQMRVNPTTSLNRMVTSGNTWERDWIDMTSRQSDLLHSVDGGTHSWPIFRPPLHNLDIAVTQAEFLHSWTQNIPFYDGSITSSATFKLPN